ncbi:MAG: cell division protein ZapA [Muribaculaceae bacterium]|nr:cell division protein ZapA [Muribaculaceae bacterium]
MKGSDKVEMTLNIGGELIKLDVKFDEQNEVREAEREIKIFIDRLRRTLSDASDRKLIAMAAFQFASWYNKLIKIQQDAIEMANLKSKQIEDLEHNQISPNIP